MTDGIIGVIGRKQGLVEGKDLKVVHQDHKGVEVFLRIIVTLGVKVPNRSQRQDHKLHLMIYD